jgi:AraC family transcriptional regulator, transcriptional activator FtrA
VRRRRPPGEEAGLAVDERTITRRPCEQVIGSVLSATSCTEMARSSAAIRAQAVRTSYGPAKSSSSTPFHTRIPICTGAFVLAAAGLLDGRRATTHWLFVDDLQRQYPDVELDPSVLYVVDGTILTSAGTAAGIDLCLHIVTSDYGADVAAAVSRRMLMPLHRSGGQAQYVDTPVPQALGDEMTVLLAWAVARIPAGLSVDDLARHAAVGPRTLTRRFRQATGLAPGEWLQGERLRLARRLLETSDDSIERVSQNAGYDTTVAMRAQFARRLHTSPRAYRRTFRAA